MRPVRFLLNPVRAYLDLTVTQPCRAVKKGSAKKIQVKRFQSGTGIDFAYFLEQVGKQKSICTPEQHSFQYLNSIRRPI